jgi:hypothetical protein
MNSTGHDVPTSQGHVTDSHGGPPVGDVRQGSTSSSSQTVTVRSLR